MALPAQRAKDATERLTEEVVKKAVAESELWRALVAAPGPPATGVRLVTKEQLKAFQEAK